MEPTREQRALDNIHDIAVWILGRTEDKEARKALQDIISISRHKMPELPFLDMEKYKPSED